jgi:imidazolonepropionase-like amidohydrolase
MYRMFAAVAASIAFASSSWAAESVTLIHAGELLAVPGQAPGRNKTIIIEDGQIADVRNGFVEAESIDGGAAVIDLRDKFVLPGLMDMHVHLQFELGPENDRDALKMYADAQRLLRNENARGRIHDGARRGLFSPGNVRDARRDQ